MTHHEESDPHDGLLGAELGKDEHSEREPCQLQRCVRVRIAIRAEQTWNPIKFKFLNYIFIFTFVYFCWKNEWIFYFEIHILNLKTFLFKTLRTIICNSLEYYMQDSVSILFSVFLEDFGQFKKIHENSDTVFEYLHAFLRN